MQEVLSEHYGTDDICIADVNTSGLSLEALVALGGTLPQDENGFEERARARSLPPPAAFGEAVWESLRDMRFSEAGKL